MLDSILAGSASALAGAGIQQVFTDYNRKEDFSNYQKAQEQNFQNAQDSQRLAPLQTKLGMVAAGLNPAGMSNPTPASVASAPLGSHASPSVNFANDTASLAQSRLANAEAEKVELKNEQTKHENSSSFENYFNQLGSVISLYESRGFKQQADRLREEKDNLERLRSEGRLDWNVGDLNGAIKAFGSIDKLQERLQQQLSRQFETEKNFNLLINGSSFEVAKMPKLQREMLEKQMSVQIATQALLASQKILTDEQKNEVLMMEDKIGAEIAQLDEQGKLTSAQANLIKNADWKSLFANGQILQGGVAFVDDYVKEILHTIGGLAHAIVGLKTGKGIADAISKQGEKLNKNSDVTDSPIITPHKGAVHKKTMLNGSVPRETYEFDDWSY